MLRYEKLGLRLKGRWIFEGLSGAFSPGELVGICGPNGSGKSSFLRCLASLLNPTTGEIFLEQKSLSLYTLEELSLLRSYMRLETSCQWDLTLEEILQLYKRGSCHAQRTLLKEIGFEFPLQKKFSSLSSGERSLFLLGLALGNNSLIILLDEMTAMLDEERSHHVMKILCKKAEMGKAIVLILHDRLLAEKYCHRILKF